MLGLIIGLYVGTVLALLVVLALYNVLADKKAEHKTFDLICSKCGKTSMMDETIEYKYCPHCGTRLCGKDGN